MKIGLLAMSGVRAHDKELMELGLTLPGFVDRSRVIAQLPSLGLLYLAAVTPAEHEVVYFEAPGDGEEPDDVYDCDLVAISTFSAQVPEAYAIADRLRKHGVCVAMGGLHVSVCPDEALEHADFVVLGEGERMWPRVVEAVAQRTGENSGQRVFDARLEPPLAIGDLPVPRYDLLRGRPYNRFTVQTSRGCPWRCDFCASTVMLGHPYRKRPVADVLRDIEAICEVTEHPFIEFADDNTFVDKRWGRRLCQTIQPLRLKWFTETDISVADDPQLLNAMREAGCRQVLIGLESPEAESLEGLEMRTNFKARRAEDYRDAVRRIQDHGITVNGCFIVGLDEQTPDVFQRIRDFAMDVPLYEVQVTVLTPFPGTPLYSRLEAEGRLLYPGQWERCTLFDLNFTPKRMTVDELRCGFRWLVGELYSQEATQQRRNEFFRRLKHQHRQHVRGYAGELH